MGNSHEDEKAPTRRLQFSSNRGAARHRVRYVESSAPASGECRLCVGSLADTPVALHFRGPLTQMPPLPMQVVTDNGWHG
ncbi:MAG: hypothetical protein R3292_08955 [Alcanivorax sp.]|nr:hypothetical protein [Alcanivorax sp.]